MSDEFSVSEGNYAARAVDQLRQRHGHLVAGIVASKAAPAAAPEGGISDLALRRTSSATNGALSALEKSPIAAQSASRLFADWMNERAVVRVIGYGQARLAATVAVHNLLEGGARVAVQDDLLPTPSSLSGGGIIAVCVGDEFDIVQERLQQVRNRNRDIRIVALSVGDEDFADYADVHIAMSLANRVDLGHEPSVAVYAMMHLIDALVMHAGQSLGYTETRWLQTR